MQGKSEMLLGIGNGAIAGALWGFVFLAPQLLPGFSSAQLSVARYLVYGLFSLLLLAPRWRALPQLGGRDWFALVRLSLLGNIVYYVLLAYAIRLAGGAAASLILGLVPVVVSFVGVREGGAVRLSRLIPPMLLCCAGVALIGYEALRSEALDVSPAMRLLGIGCAFGALASWSAYAIFNSRHLTRLAQVSSHDWSLLTGVVTGALALALGVLVFALESPDGAASHGGRDWLRFWAVSAGVAVFASIIGNRFWNQASRLLPLTLMGQMIVFETLFALLYSFLWEQRLPTPIEVLAIVCLVVGIAWCASAHRSKQQAAAAPENIP
jgi:drug/metabolite transporter (DMT)-like permease